MYSRRWALAASYAVLLVGALLVVGPFVWQALTSVKSFQDSVRIPPVVLPSPWDWSGYARVFEVMPLGRQFVNTVLMAGGRTIAQLIFCSLAAFAFARLEFPGRRFFFGLFLVVLMVPSQLFVIPQFLIMQQLGWLNTIQALIVPGMFSAFGTFLLRQFFVGLPRELDEAAELDGCGPLQRYWRILLPLSRPGLIALAVLTLLWSWNDLMWPLIVNTDPEMMTLSAGLAALSGQHNIEYPALMAGSLMATAPVIVIFAILQKQVIEGIANTGGKS
ncbi:MULTISPECIES: carbohydrate ABC transporter permease [Streptosporangium]|uniref:Multiple sugar transport system permease protein n=1 Tax=Streptosporangium brasiliense TaxID=47480 RepID=A0ABT9R104_9ACTN|nr:carbohydrate ABC transporter permease [Streptosporangium brasiliense]MDP9862522.1 multiple sugar transport system permease protein [Streptosporangium brasiliense]